MKKKSAKDLAFDRERSKYNGSIRKLENQLKLKDVEIRHLRGQIATLEDKCETLQEEIDQLLTYVGLSEEELQDIIKGQKQSAETAKLMLKLFAFPRL